MNLGQSIGRLAFDDQPLFDDEVGSVLADEFTSIVDIESNLRFGRKTSVTKFRDHRPPVDRFKQAVPEGVVDREEATDDLFGKLPVGKLSIERCSYH
jgi:hypothetical protein